MEGNERMTAQVKRIIEYQAERQRTPKECVQFLQDKVDRGEIKSMIVIWNTKDDKLQGYAPASEDRHYKKSAILWDYEQWKKWFLESD